MTAATASVDQHARDVAREILDSAVIQGVPLSLVDSPPGAGKTWMVERTVSLATSQRMTVCCVMPRAQQGFDLVRRLGEGYDLPRLQLLVSKDRSPPSDLPHSVDIINNVGSMGTGPGVVVSTVDKVAIHLPRLPENEFDLLVVDEAYQLAFKQLLAVTSLARRVLLVGDPGQLPRFAGPSGRRPLPVARHPRNRVARCHCTGRIVLPGVILLAITAANRSELDRPSAPADRPETARIS